MTKKRLAIYARVSTDDQDGSNQLERLRDWADRAGYDIHEEALETASGRLVRRPHQAAIMRAAKGHHIHAVAVCKVDRWARSVQHLATTIQELHDLNVEFHAIDQGLRVIRGNPTANLILNILAAVAEWEATIISERTKDALAAKKRAGVTLGRHRNGCGTDFPCPTGVHKPKKGMQKTAPSTGRDRNE